MLDAVGAAPVPALDAEGAVAGSALAAPGAGCVSAFDATNAGFASVLDATGAGFVSALDVAGANSTSLVGAAGAAAGPAFDAVRWASDACAATPTSERDAVTSVTALRVSIEVDAVAAVGSTGVGATHVEKKADPNTNESDRRILVIGIRGSGCSPGRYHAPSPRRNAAGARLADPQSSWFEVSRSKERKKANEHGLVLQSVGVQTGQMQAEGLWIVLVRLEDLERSRAEIERYERENVGWPPRESYPKPISQGLWAALVYSTLLALLHIWQKNGEFGFEWLAAGRSDAARVSDGEWWRAITALTLHGDVAHLLGNIVFGSVFGVILAQSIGVGLAWNAFLLAGALGNLINAWIQPSEHASIGASTAVFGGLGTQVAYEWMKRRELAYPTLRRWAPVIGGVALLGWLGAGGTFREGATMRENLRVLDDALSKVDVLAHVTGFASGALLGVLLGLRKRRPWMPMHWQIVLTLVPVAVIASAWAIALTR